MTPAASSDIRRSTTARTAPASSRSRPRGVVACASHSSRVGRARARRVEHGADVGAGQHLADPASAEVTTAVMPAADGDRGRLDLGDHAAAPDAGRRRARPSGTPSRSAVAAHRAHDLREAGRRPGRRRRGRRRRRAAPAGRRARGGRRGRPAGRCRRTVISSVATVSFSLTTGSDAELEQPVEGALRRCGSARGARRRRR